MTLWRSVLVTEARNPIDWPEVLDGTAIPCSFYLPRLACVSFSRKRLHEVKDEERNKGIDSLTNGARLGL